MRILYRFWAPAFGFFFASAAVAAPPTTEQKVLAAIGEFSQVGTNLAASFGHGSAAGLISEIPTFAIVFAGLFDSIRGLFQHVKPAAPAAAA